MLPKMLAAPLSLASLYASFLAFFSHISFGDHFAGSVSSADLSSSSMVSSNVLAAFGYASLVVFGDSLSDNGNGSYKLTNHSWPADKAYFDGRFSNGPTYVEYLANDLGIPALRDHAYGGATINNSFIAGGTGFNSTIPVPATLDQVKAYYKKATNKKRNGKDLVLISGGNNDAFFLPTDQDPTAAATTAAIDLINVAKIAYHHGARHFIVPEGEQMFLLPASVLAHFHMLTPCYCNENLAYCLEKIPFATQVEPTAKASLSTFKQVFNHYLGQHARRQLPKDITLTTFETCRALRDVKDHPQKYGFDNTVDACLQGVYGGETVPRTLCDDPYKYVFWDIYHPTTHTHRLIADEAKRALEAHHLQTRLSRPLQFLL